MPIEPGLVSETEIIVQENETARFSGGDTLPAVFSTPRLISRMEQTAHQSVYPYLAENQTTVGVLVNIRHLAATPIGMHVRFRSELIEVDRRRLKFKVEAWDDVEKIGEGEHERYIIDCDRFLARLEEKRSVIKG